MRGFRGRTVGRLCVTTCMQGTGAPLVDDASTRVTAWGDGMHGSIVIRRPGTRAESTRALCLVVRGWNGPHMWLWRSRWRRVRHPLRTFRARNAPRGAVMMGTTSSDVASAVK